MLKDNVLPLTAPHPFDPWLSPGLEKKQWKYICNDGGIIHVLFFNSMKTFVSQDIIYASKKFWIGNYLHIIYYYNLASIKTIFTQSMSLSKYFQLKIKNC